MRVCRLIWTDLELCHVIHHHGSWLRIADTWHSLLQDCGVVLFVDVLWRQLLSLVIHEVQLFEEDGYVFEVTLIWWFLDGRDWEGDIGCGVACHLRSGCGSTVARGALQLADGFLERWHCIHYLALCQSGYWLGDRRLLWLIGGLLDLYLIIIACPHHVRLHRWAHFA